MIVQKDKPAPPGATDEEKKLLLVQSDIWEIFRAHSLDAMGIAQVSERMLLTFIINHVSPENWELALAHAVKTARRAFTEAQADQALMTLLAERLEVHVSGDYG